MTILQLKNEDDPAGKKDANDYLSLVTKPTVRHHQEARDR